MSYGVWTRLEEIIEFAWRAQFNRLGLAFRMGLSKEEARLEMILRNFGVWGGSRLCTRRVAVRRNSWESRMNRRSARGSSRSSAILSAVKVKTDLNIVIGLCVGHDTLSSSIPRPR